MIQIIIQNIFWFILLITVVVFIHEFGHYYVAKKCGVKIEEFSIGFGKEIFGINDKSGVRWKFCLIPFGGYVKMFGDRNAASTPDFNNSKEFSDQEKRQSFVYKNVYQKMIIVAAGPIANFILGIFLFTILFKINGYNTTSTIIKEVVKDSPAMSSGILAGDKVLAVNDRFTKDFIDVQNIISPSTKKDIKITLCRHINNKVENNNEEFAEYCNKVYKKKLTDGDNIKIIEISLTPEVKDVKNIFDDKQQVAIIGITPLKTKFKNINILESFQKGCQETYRFSTLVLVAIKELITGDRSIQELSGPIKIAKYSGKTAQMGLVVAIWFTAIISINLGVINILPIPVLDGGHLLFYFIEEVYGKPLPKKVQEIGFRIGFAILVTLIIFTTLNDLNQILNK